MVIVGGALVVQPTIDRMCGEWRQQERAAASDAAIPRYRNAMSAAYGALTSDFEDALVTYEVGALPTAADGNVIELPPDPVATVAEDVDIDVEVVASAPAPVVPAAKPPRPAPVFSEAVIRIPAIGLSQAVVEGVSRSHLKQGPGHYPGTAVPGFRGNVVISGHRTTYTQPFYDLDLLVAGDAIVIDTPAGSYRYLVESAHVVSSDDATLLTASDRAILTLTTCTPKGSARDRLIIVSVLDGIPVDAIP
jgi:sortase A